MIQPPTLKLPDFTMPFYLTTDASNFAVGAVLEQETMINNKRVKQPVAFASNLLINSQLHYAAYQKEAFAVYWAVKKFAHYL